MDSAALSLLEERGIGPEAWERMERLGSIARMLPEDGATIEEEAAEAEALLESLKALRVWYEEWSALARIAITQRADLIRLGLAQRRTPRAVAPAPVDPVPAPIDPA